MSFAYAAINLPKLQPNPMRKFLLPVLFFVATLPSAFAQVVSGNCLYVGSVHPDNRIMCFTDPSLMNGDVITLTEAQFNDTDFLMTLVDTSFNNGMIRLRDNCDETAGVKIIRQRRLTNNFIASSRNNTSKITFSLTSTDLAPPCVGANYELSLNVRVIAPIPTLSQWGLLIFALLLLNIGGVFIWRNQYSLRL